ncbi:MAG: DegT/DnrJ/EryC1/StrS family aminotransferase [Candidatus Omnitrophota bacterium]
MKMHIPVSGPLISGRAIRNVISALEERSISGLCGRYLNEFEGAFARYCGSKFGVATNSGTTALHIACAALGIKKGDEVLVSTFTNMATIFSILYQGARPVAVDIEPDTWNMDPGLLEKKVTSRTKAILAVHIYGHPADMSPILSVARRHGLYVIEDAAEAHGALYNGRKVGSFGDAGCFSFYANKIITTGEGGMLVTQSRRLADKARSLKSLAFGDKNKFMHQDIGFGYRMTNIQAAIGCAQLEDIDKIISRKRQIAKYYNEGLADVKGLQLPVEKGYARCVYWMYHVVVHKKFGISRDLLMKRLAACGIETRESFVPYNMQRIFIRRGWVKPAECPVANYAARNGLYLPSGPGLKEKELNYIVDKITSIQRKSR